MNKNEEQQIFKEGSTTFYFSSRFFPKTVRDDVFKLYSFVRVSDDYVDEKPTQPAKLLALEKAYSQALEDPQFEHITHEWDERDERVLKNIVALTHKYKFDPEWVRAFFKAMKSDIKHQKKKTLQESLDYVYGSAEVIGLMMVKIMGVDDPEAVWQRLEIEKARKDQSRIKGRVTKLKYKIKHKFGSVTKEQKESVQKEIDLIHETAKLQGRAMQWINFIRDIKEDNEMNRQYLPTSELKKYNLADLSEKTARKNEEKYKKYIQNEINRYKDWQTQAEAGFIFVPTRLRIPIQTAVDMFNWTAQQILDDPFVVFEKKVKPNKAQVLGAAAKRGGKIQK
ncbi:MAG: squalene/phytoene synthase family protein [bacterium]|nr:squalene/phytoene synthase family protein [bacterium]